MNEKKVIKKILRNRKHKNTGAYFKDRSPIKSWNNDKINLTVALPIYNGYPIVELALKSLVRQKNIDFSWELIIMEDFGVCRNLINSYRGKMPGCKRVRYMVSETKIPLLDKWSIMARASDENSNVFVLQAADCYSADRRLKAHYDIHKNNGCVWSHQKKGVFYNIRDKNVYLYDGSKYSGENLTHLSMALDTRLLRNIPTYSELKKYNIYKDSRIDSHLLRSIKIQEPNGSIGVLEDLYNDIWKTSLDTDGKNNISKTRFQKFGTEHFLKITPEVQKDYEYIGPKEYINNSDLAFLDKII